MKVQVFAATFILSCWFQLNALSRYIHYRQPVQYQDLKVFFHLHQFIDHSLSINPARVQFSPPGILAIWGQSLRPIPAKIIEDTFSRLVVNIPPGSVDPPDSRLKVKPQYTTARDNFNKEANFLTSDSVLKYLGCVLESPLLCLDGGPGGWRKSQFNGRFHKKSRRLLLEKSLCIEKLTWAAVPWDDCDEEYPALPVWLVVLEFRVWPSSPGMSVNRKLGIEDMHKVHTIHTIFSGEMFTCHCQCMTRIGWGSRATSKKFKWFWDSVANKTYLGGEVGSNERGDSLSKGNPRSSSPGNRIGWNGFVQLPNKLNVQHFVNLCYPVWCVPGCESAVLKIPNHPP